MPPYTKILLSCLLTIFCLVPAFNAQAQPKYYFKIASIAPDGSVWTKKFQDFANEVSTKTNGEVGFKVYSGGVMGNDQSVYRKMRIGQLQGGGFTMTGIGEVVNDFRVLGVPFLFDSYDEVDSVVKALWPSFKKAFDEKDLVLLAMSEVGFVYAMSTFPIRTVDDMRRSKCWVPEGDAVSPAYLKEVGVSGTPLSIPDVLSSLQTGLIDTVFNSFYGTIVLQWFTKANYVSDIPFGYGYGAFVMDKKKFSRLPPEYAALIEEAALRHFRELLDETRKSNAESLEVLKKNGVSLVTVEDESKKELKAHREASVGDIIGSAFSPEIYQEVIKDIEGFRAAGK